MKMNNRPKLVSFSHPFFGQLTTVQLDDGTIMFKANDVALALGYSAPQCAIYKLCDNATFLKVPTAGGLQRTKFINQADLLKLVMRSRLPEAERFRDWVCEKVIPDTHNEIVLPFEDVHGPAKETTKASMDKAVKVIKFKCKLGFFTFVQTQEGENLFIANEIAHVLGYGNIREYLRNSEDARNILTIDNRCQQVTCISMEAVIRLASLSALPQAREFAYNIRLFQKKQEIESLKTQNLLLADDLECAIDGLKGIREQLDLLFCDLGVNG